MTIRLLPLAQIQDNPYQTRLNYSSIEELAANIQAARSQLPETLGLIHVPNGRALADGTVQLAEGHRRLRAFRQLAMTDDAYGSMPVNIVELSDQAMDDLVWAENNERKDLNPIEEAAALKRTMGERGLTQEQLAGLRGLARSTVANKLRLLELPDDIRRSIEAGEINERQAMALLPLYQLPTEAVAALEKPRWGNSLSDLVKMAHRGETSAQLRNEAGELITRSMHSLTGVNWLDHSFPVEEPIRAATCAGCEMLVKKSPKSEQLFCPFEDCKVAKAQQWQTLQLARASEQTGIPALPAEPEKAWRGFDTIYPDELGAAVIAAGCPHGDRPHLAWVSWGGDRKAVEGFPNVCVVCVHGEGGQCPCKAAFNEQQRANDPRAKARQATEQAERFEAERIEGELIAPTAQQIAAALNADSREAWLFVVQQVGDKQTALGDRSAAELQAMAIREILRRTWPSWQHGDFKDRKKAIDQALKAAGLEVCLPQTSKGKAGR